MCWLEVAYGCVLSRYPSHDERTRRCLHAWGGVAARQSACMWLIALIVFHACDEKIDSQRLVLDVSVVRVFLSRKECVQYARFP